MALNKVARRKLAHALGGQGYASEFDTIWTSAAAISTPLRRRMRIALGNKKATELLETALEADSALNGFTLTRLGNGMASRGQAIKVSAGLG